MKVVLLFVLVLIRKFTRPRGQRPRERHRTKVLMNRTMAVHVRSEFLEHSLPSSSNVQ